MRHLGKVRVDLRKAGISMTEGIDEWINGFIRLPLHPLPSRTKTKMKGITMTTMHDDDGNEYNDDDNDGDDDEHDIYGHDHDMSLTWLTAGWSSAHTYDCCYWA